jgi:microcystin degradation protein MlrC
MRAGPGAVLPLTLLGGAVSRGSQPFDLAVCIESHKVRFPDTR